jgi:aminoglycoside phosphotransferase
MKAIPEIELQEAFAWCRSVAGPFEVLADHSKAHGNHESAMQRLRTRSGFCYLKVHQTWEPWNNEVHAYEHWAHAFHEAVPRLLAVRDEAPFALLLSELPGRPLEDVALSPSQERAVWCTAGAALVALHDLEPGACFGPCLRDGTYVAASPIDAREYVTQRFGSLLEQALHGEYINATELAILKAAYDLIPAFAGEQPTPCHRDYCAANWLVDEQGTWTGVIDFEFAYWDVRVADFSRDPNWAWVQRPDLVAAFFEGYGRPLTQIAEQQRLVAYAEYALSAIVWGRDFAFCGFEREGHEALVHLKNWL